MPDPLIIRRASAGSNPEMLFLALERASPDVFWLDAGTHATQGWSYVGTGERSEFPGHIRLDVVEDSADNVPPFRGGWVGWCDYESGARAAGAPAAASGAGAAWLHVTKFAAFDHATGAIWIAASGTDIAEWSAFVEQPEPPSRAPQSLAATAAVARHTPERYAELIHQCRELIRSGIAYQLCLTTRFTVPGQHNDVEAYRRLRAATPAHHGGFLRIDGRSLLSASPEQFLHASGGVIRTKPIKGTRPRSDDPTLDAALAVELANDAKERAENVMIVDLMRNDLSRVCVPGSIRVEGLWVVESYPAVHQLVSAVSGHAEAGVTSAMLLEATFPAGSMTGAPKLSAMTRLHELEREPRGLFAGCFGYVGADGALDLAMVIRSIIIDDDAAVVGAGGGITWNSVAAAEVAEVTTKARAPLAALGADMPRLWRSDILN